MRRSPWGAVLLSIVVMVAATTSTYLPWSRVAPPALRTMAAAWSRQDARARGWIDERRFVWALEHAAASRAGATATGSNPSPSGGPWLARSWTRDAWARSAGAGSLATPGVIGAAALLTVALIAGAIALRASRSRRRRPRVLRLARQGEAMPEIARRTGLSQDAVRLLTSPLLDPARSDRRRGKTFRYGAAAPAASAPGPYGRSRATR